MRAAITRGTARFVLLALILSAVTVVAASTPVVAEAVPPPYLTQWGTRGSGAGQFNNPDGVAVDRAGNVYVADTVNHRVQKFTSTGTYLTQWGTYGSRAGQFSWPHGVAIDGASNVYVTDTINNRVQKFTSTGTYLAQWGIGGNDAGEFRSPMGVAVDGAGNVYVTEYDNHRVQKFTSTGTFLTQWGTYGSGAYQFRYPKGVAVDGAGNVYVADSTNHRVQKFTSTGTYLTRWGTQGSSAGQFRYPNGVAVDGAGNVFVTDTDNHRVQKFTSTGTYLTQWGTQGSGAGQFRYPLGVAVDGAGNVYIADYDNNRLQKFAGGGVGQPGLRLQVSTRDWPLDGDPARRAYVELRAVATTATGARAAGVYFKKTRDGRSVTFGPRPSGAVRLVEPVGPTRDATVEVRARLGTESAESSLEMYSYTNSRICWLEGRPERRLNALRNLLNLVGVPATQPMIDGWIQAAGLLSGSLPSTATTTLVASEIRGQGLSPIYVLQIVVESSSGDTIDSSMLYSRRPELHDPVYGRSLDPLQQWALNNRCGVLA